MRVLLISSSFVHGTGYLDHCGDEIMRLYREAGVARVLFVPYAKHDHDAYFETARARFARFGLGLDSVHLALDAQEAVTEAQGFFVGGGNTFRLLDRIRREGLLDAISARVRAGAPYVGTSAGSNLGGPTIRTTNDMPIVEPESFAAFSFVPFQINPHYLPPDPSSTHMGETRDQRLAEFHEDNATPVLALREGAMVRVDGDRATLLGAGGARLFRRGQPAVDLEPPADVSHLMKV
jgi:dipeptidase E